MRFYNFRRNQSAGSKSDVSRGSKGPKIYQGDEGRTDPNHAADREWGQDVCTIHRESQPQERPCM